MHAKVPLVLVSGGGREKSGTGSSTGGRTVSVVCCPGFESEVSHETCLPLPVPLPRTALGLSRPELSQTSTISQVPHTSSMRKFIFKSPYNA